MFTWLRSLFAWKRVDICKFGVWTYWENTVTGERQASRSCTVLPAPINRVWLEAGTRWKQFGEESSIVETAMARVTLH